MKAHLLHEAQDFDFAAGLPPGHEALIQDLELTNCFESMASGDEFLIEVSRKVLLASLHDPQAIRYRQQVLADCLAQPEIIREMYAVAVGALQDKRQLWWEATAGLTKSLIQSFRRGQAPRRLRSTPQATAQDRRPPCREIPLPRANRAIRDAAG